MPHRNTCRLAALAVALACCSGCYSPYAADRGALVGGVGGAGVGALVGNAVGHPGVGALVGAGVGAASGAVIGNSIDQAEARNRAMIEARLGRPVAVGAVTVNDVVSMTAAGVSPDLQINHIRAHGVATPLQAADLIVLQQHGVSSQVVQAMQTTAVPVAAPPGAPVIVQQAPPPVYYAAPPPPYWGPAPYYRYW